LVQIKRVFPHWGKRLYNSQNKAARHEASVLEAAPGDAALQRIEYPGEKFTIRSENKLYYY